MRFARMIMEAEAPNLIGYEHIAHNLAESSVRDRSLGELGIELGDMLLPYGHHFGEPKLRNLIAEQSAANLSADNVLVTAGAAGALFLVSSSLLERGDRIVVGFPNYATNYETPLAIGCDVVYHCQEFDDGFEIDLRILEEQVTSNTKLVSLTAPHNPSGVMISESELQQVISLVEDRDTYLVFDETYRDMTYGTPLPVAASLSNRVVSIGSMSKTWGVPGIRIGWLITQNLGLVETFIAGKEQIGITGSVVDEEIAYQILSQKDTLLPKIRDEMFQGLELLENWVNSETDVEWVRPGGGVTAIIRLSNVSDGDMTRLYSLLKNEYQVHVAPGYWFKMPLNYMRIGFCWSGLAETKRGLEKVSSAIRECSGN